MMWDFNRVITSLVFGAEFVVGGIPDGMVQASCCQPSPTQGHGDTCDKIWRGDLVLGFDLKPHKCDMVRLGDSFVLGGGTPPHVCVRNYSEAISNSIRENGMWRDCQDLPLLWASILRQYDPDDFSLFAPCSGVGARELFVDVGANIGSCTLQMIARPDVHHVVAFEPNPENLFYLTSSMLANADYAKKFKLFPLAVGNNNDNCCLFMDPGNPGNTVLGRRAQKRMKREPVRVDTVKLDDVFFSGPRPAYIRLMKLDAQGLELDILRGASRLLEYGAVNAIAFEFATSFLRYQGHEPIQLFLLLYRYGYDIYKDNGILIPLGPADLRRYACPLNYYVADFLAVYNRSRAQQYVLFAQSDLAGFQARFQEDFVCPV